MPRFWAVAAADRDRTHMRQAAGRTTVATVVVALLLAACGAPGADEPDPADAPEHEVTEPAQGDGAVDEDEAATGGAVGIDGLLRAAAEATCALAEDAEGQPEEVSDRFWRGVHDDLHDVADELVEIDRPAAGRILEAKNRVEALLRDEPIDGPALTEALEELAGSLGAGTDPQCP